MPQFLDSTAPDFDARFKALLEMKREDAPDVDDTVAAIIADLRRRGDAALIELTERFDRLTLTPESFAFTPEEIAQAIEEVPQAERDALESRFGTTRGDACACWPSACGSRLDGTPCVGGRRQLGAAQRGQPCRSGQLGGDARQCVPW